GEPPRRTSPGGTDAGRGAGAGDPREGGRAGGPAEGEEAGVGRPRQGIVTTQRRAPLMSDAALMQERTEEFRKAYGRIFREIGKVIVGHSDIVHGVLTCLFVGGHALLEGVPGLGKTLLVRTLSQVLHLKFSRIQFTPDLMPSDIIGTNIISEAP